MLNYDRESDRKIIAGRINPTSILTICLKVKDETELLEEWIDHHSKIVGHGNLIIADNLSTNQGTLGIYKRYANVVNIFQFSGSHNEIHWHPRFSELYSAVRAKCQYFAFVDADERLVWIDGNTWKADRSLLGIISSASPDRIIPTTWLINSINSLSSFTLLDTEGRPRLENNLKWGKPILPGYMAGIQPGIHNVQFSRFAFCMDCGVRFFLLHYTQLPQQRLAANKTKLVSRGIVEDGATIEDILSIQPSANFDATCLRFLAEIRQMVALTQHAPAAELQGELDTLTLSPDGSICFNRQSAQDKFVAFLHSGAPLIADVLETPISDLFHPNDARSMLEIGLHMRHNGNCDAADALFRRGSTLFPSFLDRFDDPAFLKELLRSLLARREWAASKDLVRRAPHRGRPHWHCILFARAFAQAGDKRRAAYCWNLVLAHDPSNGEAKSYLALEGTGRTAGYLT